MRLTSRKYSKEIIFALVFALSKIVNLDDFEIFFFILSGTAIFCSIFVEKLHKTRFELKNFKKYQQKELKDCFWIIWRFLSQGYNNLFNFLLQFVKKKENRLMNRINLYRTSHFDVKFQKFSNFRSYFRPIFASHWDINIRNDQEFQEKSTLPFPLS